MKHIEYSARQRLREFTAPVPLGVKIKRLERKIRLLKEDPENAEKVERLEKRLKKLHYKERFLA